MVGYAGSPTYTAHVDMTLTRSKVKIKVTKIVIVIAGTPQEAGRAGGDDRQKTCGAVLLVDTFS